MSRIQQIVAIAVLLHASALANAADAPVRIGAEGRLIYEQNQRGDRVPDFSTCGYAAADRDPPEAAVQVIVDSVDGDNTRRIQAAIDYVAALPADEKGVRGAVLLAPGEHRVAGRLRIGKSGVVLRGAGADRTALVATGAERSPLVRIGPAEPAQIVTDTPIDIVGGYTPVGSTRLELPSEHGFRKGDSVAVTRPSTDAWIEALNARVDGVGWRAGRCDVRWERTITAVEGRIVTLDAPITTALDAAYGGGLIARIESNSRLREIGVEDLTLRSDAQSDNALDEDHSWHGVAANDTQDLWVRRVRFTGFAGGAVLLREGVRRASVEDCLYLAPRSELGGYRRQSFFTQGQQTLFLRCWAGHGRCDFAVGHAAAGPNAFVNCYADATHGVSGPLESWASGVLYDNVRIDGGDLYLGNRWADPPGVGWSAANCVAWQCQAAQLHCFSPPTAQNWAIGYWARPLGDGAMNGLSEFVRPISLYRAQLTERLGETAAERVDGFLLHPVAATNPTLAETEAFVAESDEPPHTLRDAIEERLAQTPLPSSSSDLKFESVVEQFDAKPPAPRRSVRVVNGWLTIDGRVVTGGAVSPLWWRGTVRPAESPAFGPAITRYAPGRYGVGLTDDLTKVADAMQSAGQVVYDHHYGLWYDRRRDDHLMVRRATGAVAPPFYEQPFARTGSGRAWDGLSKYDLTRFNRWYWDRLARFAKHCDERGLLLMHQCFFQHNLLEAGAHWADSPWRPANNVNAPGITEPPPYVGDKRVFVAHQFYDPDNAPLRALQRGYIDKCVENFVGFDNVIQFTGDEYSGPAEFAGFWLDTVASRRDAAAATCLIGLSAPKDVQDAILADPRRRGLVDLIDIRYWCYTRDGALYAPPGGANLSPRQHLRQSPAEPGDFASVSRAVREYRMAFPGKPVTFFADRFCRTPCDGWAVLMGGGSLADTPDLPDGLRRDLVDMRPVTPEGALLLLVRPDGGRLVYATQDGQRLTAPDDARAQHFEVAWITPATGRVSARIRLAPGATTEMTERVAWVQPMP